MNTTEGKPTIKQIGLVGILIFVGLSFFYPSLDSPFIYDDFKQILLNEKIQNIADLKGVVFNGLRQKRVIQNIGFALDWQISKGKPWSFHLQNLFWHGLCSFFVFLILIRFFPKQTFIPFAGTILFILHPFQHQSVVYIMGRIALLQAFFYLITLTLLLYRPQWIWRRNILIWISLFAKETYIILPLFIGICDYLMATDGRKFSWKPHLTALLGVILLSPVIFITLKDPGGMYQDVVGLSLYPFWEHLLTQGYYFLFYIFLFFNPAHQAMIHQIPAFNSTILVLGVLGISLFSGISIYFWQTKNKNRPWMILWVLLIFQLTPSSTFLQMINPFAEYRFYLGTLFLCVGTTFLLDKVLKIRPVSGILTTGVLAVYFLFFNYAHQRTWQRIFTTYDYALQLYPHSPILNYGIGLEYFVREKFEESKPFFLKTIELQQKDDLYRGFPKLVPYYCLARAYVLTGEYRKALHLVHPIVPFQTTNKNTSKDFWELKLFLYKKFKEDQLFKKALYWANQYHPGYFKE